MTGDRAVAILKRMLQHADQTPHLLSDDQFLAIDRILQIVTTPLTGKTTLAKTNTHKKKKNKRRTP